MMITLIGEDKLVDEYKLWLNVLNKDAFLALDKIIQDALKQEAYNFALNNLFDTAMQKRRTFQKYACSNFMDICSIWSGFLCNCWRWKKICT